MPIPTCRTASNRVRPGRAPRPELDLIVDPTAFDFYIEADEDRRTQPADASPLAPGPEAPASARTRHITVH